jgi:hypothetical protein
MVTGASTVAIRFAYLHQTPLSLVCCQTAYPLSSLSPYRLFQRLLSTSSFLSSPLALTHRLLSFIQIDRLLQSQEDLSAHVRNLERNYHDVLVEMAGFQRTMAQQDGLMQNLIQWLMSSEGGGAGGNVPSGGEFRFK